MALDKPLTKSENIALDEYDVAYFKKCFLDNMRAVESEYKISRAQIAQICHVTRPTVTQWFSGENWPRMMSVFYLARAINVDVSDFFRENGVHMTLNSATMNYMEEELIAKEAAFNAAAKEAPITEESNLTESTDIPPANDQMSAQSLSPVERSIIANFRTLNQKGRNFILHALSLESKYAKDSQVNYIRSKYGRKNPRPSKRKAPKDDNNK